MESERRAVRLLKPGINYDTVGQPKSLASPTYPEGPPLSSPHCRSCARPLDYDWGEGPFRITHPMASHKDGRIFRKLETRQIRQVPQRPPLHSDEPMKRIRPWFPGSVSAPGGNSFSSWPKDSSSGSLYGQVTSHQGLHQIFLSTPPYPKDSVCFPSPSGT